MINLPTSWHLGFCALLVCGNTVAASNPYEYVISETAFQPAIPLQKKLSQRQGELYFKDSGLFFGASDAVFEDRIVSKEHTEVDAYAGIKKDFGLLGYHFGIKSYNRSIEKDLEFQEYFVGGNIKNLSFSYASNDLGEYTQLNISQPVSSVILGIHVGKTQTLLGDEYNDWSLHASKDFKKVKLNAIMSNSDNPRIKGTEFNLGLERKFKWF